MVNLTKEEIATLLRDYANFSKLITNYPTITFENLFSIYMLNENRPNDINIEYYEKMIRVYAFFTLLKLFSFSEDYLVNDKLISNEELDFDNIKEKIFTNPNDAKYFNSKKNIITYIRNAFNHSDNNKNLYSISKNTRYLKIDLEHPKENHPLHLKMTIEDLTTICNAMLKAKRTIFLTTFDIDKNFNINSNNLFKELDKIKFIYYNFTKKISHNTLNNISLILKKAITTKSERDKKSNDLKNTFLNEFYTTQSYQLSDKQKQKFSLELEKIKYLIKNKQFIQIPNLKEETNYYTYYILKKCIPLGSLKYDQIMLEYQLCTLYLQDISLSYEKILNNIKNIYLNIKDKNLDNYDALIHNIMNTYYNTPTQKLDLILNSYDLSQKELQPLLIYLEYITNNLYNDEYINIKTNNYQKERIRNAFVHGRLFTSSNSLELYDGPSGNKNYYNFDWHQTINIHDFKNWAEEFYNKNIINKETKILKRK